MRAIAGLQLKLEKIEGADYQKERLYMLGLSHLKDIGPVSLRRLLEYFGSAKRVWKATQSELKQVKGIGVERARIITEKRKDVDLEKIHRQIQSRGMEVLVITDECYPVLLKYIHDPPPVLYIKGSLQPGDFRAVSVVGTRRATAYGRRTAEMMGRNLAREGITVVSGMARGIDTAAHRGALRAAGRTIAVLGSGLDIVYPPENQKLMKMIVENGAVVSEFPPGTTPEAKNFPARNRIVSGLSLGTVVVEAPEKSGALITADLALEQGRDVFAVPGRIDSPQSTGANDLLRHGAIPVTGARDIIDDLRLERFACNDKGDKRNDVSIEGRPSEPQKGETPSSGSSEDKKIKKEDVPSQLDENERVLFELIAERDRAHIDYLVRRSPFSAPEIGSLLTRLELKGAVRQLPGKYYILK